MLCFTALSLSAQYVDLGLPSGTLWKQENESGYYIYGEALRKFGNQLPTKEQCEELVNYCTWKWGWSFSNGTGYTVTGRNGNQIFIPASGFRSGDTWQLYNKGEGGWLWSSTYTDEYDAMYGTIHCGYAIMCASFSVELVTSHITTGNSVRLVKKK